MRVGDRSRLVELRDVRLGNRRSQVVVALRHPDIGVAEQVADDEERRSAHHQVARVRVPQHVRPERRDAGPARHAVESIRQILPVVLCAVRTRKDVGT